MSDRVDDLLEERIDGTIESVVWHRSSGDARIGLVTSLTDDDRAMLTTVILDVEDDTLRIHGDNSMWLPGDGDVLDAAIRSLARTCSAATDSIDDEEPLRNSLLDLDAEAIGDYQLVDDYDPSDSGGDWKADEGADEMDVVHERLAEVLEDPDRMIRLEFGGKAPWEGEPQRIPRHPDAIGGNYGVEAGEETDLVIVDVDDMELAPVDEMPETLRVESPHGGIHLYYHVPGAVAHFADRFDKENPHQEWGEVRAGDGYVVGPGSTLDDCKHDCCTPDDPGEYVLEDAPIETLDPETIADLLVAHKEGSA